MANNGRFNHQELTAIGFHILKRPLPEVFTIRASQANPNPPNSPYDLDGYLMPPRAPHTVLIKVTSKTPFMASVKRVRTALNNGSQKTKGLPLTVRIAAMGVREERSRDSPPSWPISDALDDVVLVATGKAIPKALEVGAFFRRTNKELLVLFRTRTIRSIDDIVMDEDGDADEEDHVRVRHMSCIEVGIRWRT